MSGSEEQRDLLPRWLDGGCSPAERARVSEWLRADVSAREYLRELAEQAVMIADVERTEAARADARPRHEPVAEVGRVPAAFSPFRGGAWRWGMAAVAAFVVLAAASQIPKFKSRPGVKVTRVTGAGQFMGAGGEYARQVEAGASLRPGDSIETRSCDAWVELELRDGSRLTVAGHSSLRVLEGAGGETRLKLQRGNLWMGAGSAAGERGRVVVVTPTAVVEAKEAQFDLQTSERETLLRVNQGSATAQQVLDEISAQVGPGEQLAAALSMPGPPKAVPQPKPVNQWACDVGLVPEIILGRWLPPQDGLRARLGAQPLLWPIPGREPILLHAAALTVLGVNERPVVLETGARLVFHGKTTRAQTVRFGFSTQRMRGVFSGKFEMDLPPQVLGPAGEPWKAELPLADFRPLQPELSARPEGLELKDVYALTIHEDAGLEIHHIELVRE